MTSIHSPASRSVVPNGAGALIFCAIALCVGLVAQAPTPAMAAEGFTTCEGGQKKADEGLAELSLAAKMKKRLAARGLGVTLTKPAEFSGGRPTYLVRDAKDEGGVIDARLAGGFKVRADQRRLVRVRLTRFIHDGGSRKVLRGRVSWPRGSREMVLFRVGGGTVTRNPDVRRFTLDGGSARLTPGLARILRSKAGLRPARAGQPWGKLYLTRIAPFVPKVEPPPDPDPFPRPEDADTLTGGTLTWEVRKSWVDYLGIGRTTAVPPASPDPASRYRFTFDFKQGWVKLGAGGAIESASLEASGGVYFRACGNQRDYLGINFQTRAPEFEFDGSSARLVFTVEGIDQTPFPGSRAVVVELAPGEAQVDGTSASWTAMSGIVAPGAYGLFSGQYRPGSIYGDSFGSAAVTIDWVGDA